jgi:hypothetical protein
VLTLSQVMLKNPPFHPNLGPGVGRGPGPGSARGLKIGSAMWAQGPVILYNKLKDFVSETWSNISGNVGTWTFYEGGKPGLAQKILV